MLTGADAVDLEIALTLALLCALGFTSAALGSMFRPWFRIVLGIGGLLLALGVAISIAGLDVNAEMAALHAAVKISVLAVLTASMIINFGVVPSAPTRR